MMWTCCMLIETRIRLIPCILQIWVVLQVEVEVLLFREGLEDKGLSKEEIEAKVEDQRKKLLIKAEKKPSAGQPSTSERCESFLQAYFHR